jgi:tellurite resistance protein TerC
MTQEQLTYLVFGVLLVIALAFDLGLLSKSHTHVTMRKAVWQTAFWVTLALGFGVFLWFRDGQVIALEYISAYLMEWSLSIDNIFVFILIFTFFGIKQDYYARVLLIGILMAIIFRVIFITVGIALVERFHWILYIFGAILIITGWNMFKAKSKEIVDLEKNKVYRILRKFVPLTTQDNNGKISVRIDGKKHYTSIFVVIIMLATTDLVFALDSIPAVFAISQHRLVIYTSNIFAVLGLRSLFFLLKWAVNKFAHLQQGIAIVLVFIGVKMLVEFFDVHVPVYVSLLVILVCIAASIVYSISVETQRDRSGTGKEEEEDLTEPIS